MKEYIIFGRSTCPWTQKAIELVEESKFPYSFVEVPAMPCELMGMTFQEIATEKGHKTVPCVFEVTYVGGYEKFEKTLAGK